MRVKYIRNYQNLSNFTYTKKRDFCKYETGNSFLYVKLISNENLLYLNLKNATSVKITVKNPLSKHKVV